MDLNVLVLISPELLFAVRGSILKMVRRFDLFKRFFVAVELQQQTLNINFDVNVLANRYTVFKPIVPASIYPQRINLTLL